MREETLEDVLERECPDDDETTLEGCGLRKARFDPDAGTYEAGAFEISVDGRKYLVVDR